MSFLFFGFLLLFLFLGGGVLNKKFKSKNKKKRNRKFSLYDFQVKKKLYIIIEYGIYVTRLVG